MFSSISEIFLMSDFSINNFKCSIVSIKSIIGHVNGMVGNGKELLKYNNLFSIGSISF